MDSRLKIGITSLIIILISESTVVNSELTCRKPINGTACDDGRVCPSDCDTDDNCPCMDGYQTIHGPAGTDCVDIRECDQFSTHKCGANTQCKNTIGGYYCICDSGFRKGNVTQFCPSDDKSQNICTDINECQENPGICGPNSVCNNTPGSYRCSCQDNYRNISNKCTLTCNRFICGWKSVCTMKQGSINCSCQDGYTAVSMGFKYPQCNVKCRNDMTEPPCNSKQCNLDDFATLFTPSCDGRNGSELHLKLLEKLEHLFSNTLQYKGRDRLRKTGLLLKKVEGLVQNLAPLLQTLSHPSKTNHINIKVINNTFIGKNILLQGTSSSVKLDAATALGEYNATAVGSLEYRNISEYLSGATLMNNSKEVEVELASSVVSVFIGSGDTSHLSHPVELHFNFTNEVKGRKPYCAFWSTNESSWSTRGCVTQQSDAHGIVCMCNHLTSFAVLMALEEIQSRILDLITQIGLSISIVCLVLAILTFCFCRALRGKGNRRKTIHTHLSVCLLIANCIFLFGIEATGSKPLCGIIAGLLHALYLSAFCWMFLEGLELYLMLVTVFTTQLKTRYLLAVGYGVPAVIIAISAAVYHQGYGTARYCWLSLEYGFNWSFMGPVCVIILINCGIFVLTVWKLTEKMATITPEQGKFKKIRTLTITSIAQLCILGCCWAFGFLMFSTVQMFFAYAFTICNSLQGLQIYFLHCLLYKKVRDEYRMCLCAIVHLKAPVYSEFSNSSNVNTHSRVKTAKESGF